MDPRGAARLLRGESSHSPRAQTCGAEAAALCSSCPPHDREATELENRPAGCFKFRMKKCPAPPARGCAVPGPAAGPASSDGVTAVRTASAVTARERLRAALFHGRGALQRRHRGQTPRASRRDRVRAVPVWLRRGTGSGQNIQGADLQKSAGVFSSPVSRSRRGCRSLPRKRASRVGPARRHGTTGGSRPALPPGPACDPSRKRGRTCRGAAVAPCSGRTQWAKCWREGGREARPRLPWLAWAVLQVLWRCAGQAQPQPSHDSRTCLATASFALPWGSTVLCERGCPTDLSPAGMCPSVLLAVHCPQPRHPPGLPAPCRAAEHG